MNLPDNYTRLSDSERFLYISLEVLSLGGSLVGTQPQLDKFPCIIRRQRGLIEIEMELNDAVKTTHMVRLSCSNDLVIHVQFFDNNLPAGIPDIRYDADALLDPDQSDDELVIYLVCWLAAGILPVTPFNPKGK